MAVNFDFKERLGAGHFGEVWRAIDTGLAAVRAVKLIPRANVLNPQNFFHEAQILQAVEHPNIVRVKETGEMSDGRIYVAMEFLPKGSLEDEAKGAYVDLSRAKRLMVDVLRGLQNAHDRGVIHRDIKPANILIGDASEGKLSDFGLAIPMGLNLKNLGVKDYAYILHLPPEIHRGQQHDELSDIYACGVTLYRLVNGDSYIPALPAVEIRDRSIAGSFPDRRSYRDFVPRPLRTLINKSLHVDPGKRFQSAEEMRHALEQIMVEMNWNESMLTDGMQWTSGWNNRCYQITRKLDKDKKGSVTVRKGKNRKSLRIISALSKEGLTRRQAEQHARRLLQDYVLGRLR